MATTTFNELPIELLPEILGNVTKPSHIAELCLVNRKFDVFGRELLYRRVFIYSWHKNVKTKIAKLFETLASSPRLAKYVQEMTIRDFPMGLLLGNKVELLKECSRGLTNCINLRVFCWTRYGSLSSDILLALQQLPHLTDLELNGKRHILYTPDNLVKFTRLRKLSLIMPHGPIIDSLPAWIRSLSNTLEHLTFICQDARRMNDDLLGKLAPSLANLTHLYLVGCPKLTHEGLWSVVSSTTRGLRGLGLEALSPAFDLEEFSQRCLNSKSLTHLTSVTLTGPTEDSASKWAHQVVNLLSLSPLERFHVSTIGGEVGGVFSDDLCASLITRHGATLRRFSVDRMGISTQAISDICQRCPRLEQLFITAEQGDLSSLASCLSHAHSLRTLHIKRPIGRGSETAPVVPRDQILHLVNRCGSELQQIGYNTRVWQVRREVKRAEDGSLHIERHLASYDLPEIPEQFLVVRT